MPRTAKKTTKPVLTMPTPPAASAATPVFSDPVRSEVANRAYKIYCERGRQDGFDVQDWLQAERELRGAQWSAA